MTGERVYLRADVQAEPLIDRWYAWVHLITPATAAFNVVERHLKTMASYVAAPALHAAAVANPAMRGGPFIDLDGARVDELRALLAAEGLTVAGLRGTAHRRDDARRDDARNDDAGHDVAGRGCQQEAAR
ncbi:MAG: hypothetical protein KC636_18420 [Myxococcales bacterium]|nr:hypothetical protein [Myxococcales bacterium]